MTAATLLSRLDNVKPTGPGKWSACCPTHDSKSKSSLHILENPDGVIVMHDLGGCAVEEILTAVGLTFSDLYPPRHPDKAVDGGKPIRRPWIPSDMFEEARHEIGVAAIICADMADKREVSDATYTRLCQCKVRLDEIARLAYGRK